MIMRIGRLEFTAATWPRLDDCVLDFGVGWIANWFRVRKRRYGLPQPEGPSLSIWIYIGKRELFCCVNWHLPFVSADNGSSLVSK